MLVKKNLSLYQVISYTWKVDISMLLFCTLVYLVDQYIFTKTMLPIAYPSLMGTAIAFLLGLIIIKLMAAGGKHELFGEL